MEIEKEREDDNAKKKYFRDVGLLIVLCMSLYTYCNLKFNSVYYAQHIPHKEEIETDLVMLVKNVGWIYTPKIDNIIYDDGTNDIINTKAGFLLTAISILIGTIVTLLCCSAENAYKDYKLVNCFAIMVLVLLVFGFIMTVLSQIFYKRNHNNIFFIF